MADPPELELSRPAGLAAAVPYAYAATTRSRPLLVFTAGACPLDESGATLAAGRRGGAGRAGDGQPRRALQAAGARLADVVKTTVYVASSDRADLAAAWHVVHRHFAPHEPPSTLLGVGVLGYPDQLVEVEADRGARRVTTGRPAPVDDRLGNAMKVHLVDGTYELFRHFFGAPPHRNAAGDEVAAVGAWSAPCCSCSERARPMSVWRPTT